jgi:oligoendopeptidase F
MIIDKPIRHFLKQDFIVTDWLSLKPYYESLATANIETKTDLENWLKQVSELEASVSEAGAWRYIRMTCHTDNEEYVKAYTDFVNTIQPEVSLFANQFQQKLLASSALDNLDKEKYRIFIRGIKNAVELFRKENVVLESEIQNLAQQYGSISAAMTVQHADKEITLQAANKLLQETDRSLRKSIYEKIQERRTKDEDELNKLLDQLISKRHQVALNAGFKNYRDFKHKELGRFDYSVDDCFTFHQAVEHHIVPIAKQLEKERKEKLNLVNDYRPYDTSVDDSGAEALQPFTDAQELINKTITCFQKIDPYFAQCISTMNAMGHLDLPSRKAKAPGGYNYPLAEIGVPFIFMNAVGTLRDLVTMVHEGGHAIHSFLYRDLELNDFKNITSEVAELASMSMELISMEHWQLFFKSEADYTRAKKDHLIDILKTISWIAAIDKFQHFLYEIPQHTLEERYTAWNDIMKRFGTGEVNYEGYEAYMNRSWQGQLHIYEVPFYYIEYGFAQLGAIAMWKQYKINPVQAISNYKNALSLGYTKSIPELYTIAGIRFDFSESYIRDLAKFVLDELKAISA